MRLYLTFSRLHSLRWSKCKSDGVSTSLRSLKSDNQEYLADLDDEFLLRCVVLRVLSASWRFASDATCTDGVLGGCLLASSRSGGHYWFSVWQTRVADVTLGRPISSEQEREINAALGGQAATKTTSLEFLRSPRQILFGKWEKIRSAGRGPCPRRYHSMTCLSKMICPKHVMDVSDAWGAKKATVSLQDGDADDDDDDIRVRRVVFFGGHSESMPFDAFNDLHLLFISDSRDAR